LSGALQTGMVIALAALIAPEPRWSFDVLLIACA
jgi:hypothetical protein